MAKIYTGIETIKALQEGKVLVRKDEDGGNNYLKMVGGKLFYKIDNLAVDDPNVWRSDADAPDDGAYPYCLDELLSWRFKEHEEHKEDIRLEEQMGYRFGKAFATFVELKTHYYGRIAEDEKEQFFIECYANDEEEFTLGIEPYVDMNYKLVRLSPAFSRPLEARKAIEDIGKQDLIEMFKALQGIKNI